ncbi:hypothetical protein [Roseateles sp.]|uniref:hypothetical protein n=1 Tax=Roseateles sp. TaxID=1971397 RepID=UPI0039ED35A8
MNFHHLISHTDWPDAQAITYRSEAFAEDLEDQPAQSAPGWHPLERLIAALPLLCVFAPVADAYLR